MIYDIENIKIGKNRLLNGKLVYRRGENSFLVEGNDYDREGLYKLLDVDKPKPDVVTLSSAESNKSKSAVALVEPPSRILSYHLCSSEIELTTFKLAAIVRKVLIYYTSTYLKDGKYYAEQPWMIDWDTMPGQSKDFLRLIGEKYKDADIKCPFCGTEHFKLNAYISHIMSKHSYVKDKKSIEEYKPDPIENKEKLDAEIKESDFPCPHCDKVLKSASGRTNHIKSSHPEKQ